MDPIGLLFAAGAGLLVSLLPLLSWWQGAGLARQLWMILCGHGGALLAVGLLAALGDGRFGGIRFALIAAASGVGNGLNGAIYYAAVMRRGPVSVSWVVIWMSAVVVAALGWLLLGEPIYAAQPIALLCFAGCLSAMGWQTYRTNRQRGAVTPVQRGFWLWLAAAMAAGVVGVLLIKVRPPGGSHLSFVTFQLAGLLVALLAVISVLRLPFPRDRRTLATSLAWSGVIGPHFVLLVVGLERADASVFTPVLAGTALVGGVFWAALRGERPGRLVLLGAALAVVSIVLINLKFGVLVAAR